MLHPVSHLVMIIICVGHLPSGFCITIDSQVVENSPANTKVCDVANELHIKTTPTVEIMYTTSRDNEYDRYFKICSNSTSICTKNIIDRERLPQCTTYNANTCHINLIIRIGSTEILQVRVRVLDVNDNSPTFPRTRMIYNFIEHKDNQEQPIVDAVDTDFGSNGTIDYKLETVVSGKRRISDEFIISKDETKRLVIRPLINLDREKNPSYTMILTGTDGGNPPRQGSATLSIIITDINDHEPQFASDFRRSIRISESQPIKTMLIQFNATDRDEKANLEFSLDSVTGRSSLFFLSKSGQLKLQRGLDFEKNSEHNLRIKLTDGKFSVVKLFTIYVTNVNDERPIISTIAVRKPLSILENASVGTVVSLVKVTDRDDGASGEVECVNLKDGAFELQELDNHESSHRNSVLYRLKLRNHLDYEKVQMHRLKVVCYDHGNPSLTSSTLLTIYVKDINDNGPLFTKRHQVMHVSENLKIGTHIARVKAIDKDSRLNAVTRYILGTSNAVLPVNVAESTGEVTTSMVFDREVRDQYSFTVVAVDDKIRSLNSTVFVKLIIDDVNDMYPVFTSNDTFEVEENCKPQPIGRISAVDYDIGKNAMLSYSLVPPYNPMWALEASGLLRLRTSRQLDREEHSKYILTVKSSDSGYPVQLSTTMSVTIIVKDLNDEAPRFLFPNRMSYIVNVSHSAEVGAILAEIKAEDRDVGENGRIKFSLPRSPLSHYFALDPVHGILTLEKHLSTNVRGTNRLRIRIEDGGIPRKATEAELVIKIIESRRESINKNVPDSTYSKQSPRTIILIVGIILVFIILISSILMICYMCRSARSAQEDAKHGDSRRHQNHIWLRNHSPRMLQWCLSSKPKAVSKSWPPSGSAHTLYQKCATPTQQPEHSSGFSIDQPGNILVQQTQKQRENTFNHSALCTEPGSYTGYCRIGGDYPAGGTGRRGGAGTYGSSPAADTHFATMTTHRGAVGYAIDRLRPTTPPPAFYQTTLTRHAFVAAQRSGAAPRLHQGGGPPITDYDVPPPAAAAATTTTKALLASSSSPIRSSCGSTATTPKLSRDTGYVYGSHHVSTSFV